MSKGSFDDQDPQDASFMRRAVALAKKGAKTVSPNPMVGAVIVRNGRVISAGYHKRAGKAHAEIEALAALKGKSPAGATMYVTLEPCSHFGKTPPCADELIRAGLKRVVVGAIDPNPLVAGRGVRRLRRAGIEVLVGVLKDECMAINPAFNKHIVFKIPYVTLKTASTLDGRIATYTGDSRWITSEASRRCVHKLRSLNDAIVTGAGTILKDDPELTVRRVKGLNPVRVVFDAAFRVSLKAKVFKRHDSDRGDAIVVTTSYASKKKIDSARASGIRVYLVKGTRHRVDILQALKKLATLDITSVLVEAGSAMNASFFKSRAVDEAIFFLAPKVLGGDGRPSVGDMGLSSISKAVRLKTVSINRFDDDIMIRCVAHGS